MAESFQDNPGQTASYFDRLRSYTDSQAAIEQQSYTARGAQLADELSYKQRISILNNPAKSAYMDQDLSGMRRVVERERQYYKERMNNTTGRYVGVGIGTAWTGLIPGIIPQLAVGMAAYTALDSTIGAYQRRQEQYRYSGYQVANAVDMYGDRMRLGGQGSAMLSNSIGNSVNVAAQRASMNGFFNMGDLTRMNSIAAANGMFNLGGQRGIEGQTKEYTKQFEELRKNTELVVKTLKTTMEGGLKVIKDMQSMGVQNSQIGQYVGMLNTMGKVTGLGYTGMQQIGQMGAQVAQQAGYAPMAGVAQNQMNYLSLSQAYGLDNKMTKAVNAVGGLANASMISSQAQLSMLNSAVGQKMLAAVMGDDGKLDRGAFDRMATGKMHGYDITMRASAYGAKIGAAGRFAFKYDAQDVFQGEMNALDRAKFFNSYIDAWSNSYARQGTKKQKAYGALEALGIHDINTVKFLTQQYMTPIDESYFNAVDQANAAIGSKSTYDDMARRRGLFRGGLQRGVDTTGRVISTLGENLLTSAPVRGAGGAVGGIFSSIGGVFDRGGQLLGGRRSERGSLLQDVGEVFNSSTSLYGKPQSYRSYEDVVYRSTGLESATAADLLVVQEAGGFKRRDSSALVATNIATSNIPLGKRTVATSKSDQATVMGTGALRDLLWKLQGSGGTDANKFVQELSTMAASGSGVLGAQNFGVGTSIGSTSEFQEFVRFAKSGGDRETALKQVLLTYNAQMPWLLEEDKKRKKIVAEGPKDAIQESITQHVQATVGFATMSREEKLKTIERETNIAYGVSDASEIKDSQRKDYERRKATAAAQTTSSEEIRKKAYVSDVDTTQVNNEVEAAKQNVRNELKKKFGEKVGSFMRGGKRTDLQNAVETENVSLLRAEVIRLKEAQRTDEAGVLNTYVAKLEESLAKKDNFSQSAEKIASIIDRKSSTMKDAAKGKAAMESAVGAQWITDLKKDSIENINKMLIEKNYDGKLLDTSGKYSVEGQASLISAKNFIIGGGSQSVEDQKSLSNAFASTMMTNARDALIAGAKSLPGYAEAVKNGTLNDFIAKPNEKLKELQKAYLDATQANTLSALAQSQAGMAQGGGGSAVTPTVNAPTLCYWNNNWSFAGR